MGRKELPIRKLLISNQLNNILSNNIGNKISQYNRYVNKNFMEWSIGDRAGGNDEEEKNGYNNAE